MIGIGALSPSSFQVHGLPILVSYFLAVPLALICSIFGAFIAYRHFASGHGEKMCFFIHLRMKIINLSLSAVIGIAVIGPDFDIDLAFYKMTSGERLRDIIDNS